MRIVKHDANKHYTAILKTKRRIFSSFPFGNGVSQSYIIEITNNDNGNNKQIALNYLRGGHVMDFEGTLVGLNPYSLFFGEDGLEAKFIDEDNDYTTHTIRIGRMKFPE